MNKEQLVKILDDYFNINDTYCYHLTRDKEAFNVGTIKLDDFVEFDEETVNDMADYIIKKMGKEKIAHYEPVNKNRNGMRCSNCGARISHKFYVSGNRKYCYSCGARMEENRNE